MLVRTRSREWEVASVRRSQLATVAGVLAFLRPWECLVHLLIAHRRTLSHHWGIYARK